MSADPKTKLEARAMEIANELTHGEWDGPSPEDIADAMVAFAREFAAEAIEAWRDARARPTPMDNSIKAAIDFAAAEEGE